jgi:hypothetical protein
MKRIMFIGLVLGAAPAFAGQKAPSDAEVLAALKEKMVAATQARITGMLNDPESARFRKVFVSPKGKAVCGEVNAKNQMGGYVGFRRFISARDQVGIEGDDSSFVESNWEARCIKDVNYDDPPK